MLLLMSASCGEYVCGWGGGDVPAQGVDLFGHIGYICHTHHICTHTHYIHPLPLVHPLRDQRLRHHLGTRYDARDGVFDWDYHMRLAEMVRYTPTHTGLYIQGSPCR